MLLGHTNNNDFSFNVFLTHIYLLLYIDLGVNSISVFIYNC